MAESKEKNTGIFERIKEAELILTDLEKLLEDRIVDLHEVKLGQAERHLFIFYREKVWLAKRVLRNN